MTPAAFRGCRAALGTLHGKQRAISPPMLRRLGLIVDPIAIDTDHFGTFSGEVERPGTALETVRAKARAAAQAAGLPLGLASEGSFGPHPALPWIAVGEEFIALADLESGREIVERRISPRTNFARLDLTANDPPEALAAFAARVGFPRHALIVRAPDISVSSPYFKDLCSDPELTDAVSRALAAGGSAIIETDMRAHMNPTRMGEIRKVAARLARRLATPCPACCAAGFGLREVVRGLPCAACGTPTLAPMARLLACDTCGHTEAQAIPNAPGLADPGTCPECNP